MQHYTNNTVDDSINNNNKDSNYTENEIFSHKSYITKNFQQKWASDKEAYDKFTKLPRSWFWHDATRDCSITQGGKVVKFSLKNVYKFLVSKIIVVIPIKKEHVQNEHAIIDSLTISIGGHTSITQTGYELNQIKEFINNENLPISETNAYCKKFGNGDEDHEYLVLNIPLQSIIRPDHVHINTVITCVLNDFLVWFDYKKCTQKAMPTDFKVYYKIGINCSKNEELFNPPKSLPYYGFNYTPKQKIDIRNRMQFLPENTTQPCKGFFINVENILLSTPLLYYGETVKAAQENFLASLLYFKNDIKWPEQLSPDSAYLILNEVPTILTQSGTNQLKAYKLLLERISPNVVLVSLVGGNENTCNKKVYIEHSANCQNIVINVSPSLVISRPDIYSFSHVQIKCSLCGEYTSNFETERILFKKKFSFITLGSNNYNNNSNNSNNSHLVCFVPTKFKLAENSSLVFSMPIESSIINNSDEEYQFNEITNEDAKKNFVFLKKPNWPYMDLDGKFRLNIDYIKIYNDSTSVCRYFEECDRSISKTSGQIFCKFSDHCDKEIAFKFSNTMGILVKFSETTIPLIHKLLVDNGVFLISVSLLRQVIEETQPIII